MIKEAQSHLQRLKLDGWLIFDFHHSNELAHRLLKIPAGMATRRFFYWIPAKGTPIKIVHAVEEGILDHLEGGKTSLFFLADA